jgi:hypothetical protein
MGQCTMKHSLDKIEKSHESEEEEKDVNTTRICPEVGCMKTFATSRHLASHKYRKHNPSGIEHTQAYNRDYYQRQRKSSN